MNYAGRYKFEKKNKREQTAKAIEYIKECLRGEKDKSILNDIFNLFAEQGYINAKNIPHSVWKDTLIMPNRFYYHPELQIRNPLPVFDFEKGILQEHAYFLEIRKKYTMKNLLDYVYEKIGIEDFFHEEKKDIKSIEYLLNKYEKNKYVQSLDFVLYLVDMTADKNKRISKLLDIQEAELETADKIKQMITIAKIKGYNQVVWR